MDFGEIKALIKKYPLGAAGAVVALIMGGVVYFRHEAMAQQQQACDAKAAEGQQLATNVSNSAQLEEHIRDLEAANAIISSRLVNPQDLAINLQYFYKLEADTGVKLLDTRPTGSVPSKGKIIKGSYVPVQYAISLQGGFTKALTFLRRLEQGSHYCRVLSANCTQAQADQSEGQAKTADEVVLTLTVELLGRS